MPCRCCNCYRSRWSSADPPEQRLWGGERIRLLLYPTVPSFVAVAPCLPSCHEPALGNDTIPFRHGKRRSRTSPTRWGDLWHWRAIAAAAMPWPPLRQAVVDPPLFLGPPPPVGRRRRLHGGIGAHQQRLRSGEACATVIVLVTKCGWGWYGS